MPKTDDSIPQSCIYLEMAVCTAGACGAYTDISGESMSVGNTTQSRQTAETPVFGDDTPIIGGGKRQAMAVTFGGVYTEEATDFFLTAVQKFEDEDCDDSRFCMKWSPAGGNIGDREYEIRCGVIQDFDYPGGEASEASPIPWSITLFTDRLYRDTIAS